MCLCSSCNRFCFFYLDTVKILQLLLDSKNLKRIYGYPKAKATGVKGTTKTHTRHNTTAKATTYLRRVEWIAYLKCFGNSKHQMQQHNRKNHNASKKCHNIMEVRRNWCWRWNRQIIKKYRSIGIELNHGTYPMQYNKTTRLILHNSSINQWVRGWYDWVKQRLT